VPRSDDDRSPLAPGLLLGLGAGGFVDGILLHQILQWHHMVSAVDAYPPDTLGGLRTNTVADGFFHVGTWAFLLVGTALLLRAWRAGRLAPSPREQLGLVLAGWGVFNLVEGLVDHEILGVHHVRDDLGGPVSWDVGFLVFGVLLVVAGLLLRATPLRRPRPSSAGSRGARPVR
jgi:uncharacterized membrane protein